MALWNIVRCNPGTRTETKLGRVRANTSGGACLKAYRKFGVRTDEEQRKITARPVVPPKPRLPLTAEEEAELRKISDVFNRA